jgi:chitosanase
MDLTPVQKRLIERIVNVFETGTPDGDYANISIYHDGPHDIRQITYGRSQTTEYGKLRQLVIKYVDAGGAFSEALGPYVDLVGSVPLTDDAEFKNLLRKAGRQDIVMREVQDEFFDQAYFQPAIAWADEHGFAEPLSALVIYDSFIHSGSILRAIRSRFPEVPPSAGGDERAWTAAYVNARHRWLAAHPRLPVRNTVYRTRCFKNEIQRGNWDLSRVPINANGTKVSP